MMKAYLKNEASGEIYPADKDSFLVGRSDDCDIVIKEPTLSRKHLRMTSDGDRWFAEDLNSHNGSEINGAQLEPGKRQLLRNGDRLLLGTTIPLSFETEEEDATVSAARGQASPAKPRTAQQTVPQDPAPQPAPKLQPQPIQTANVRSATGEAIRAKIEAAQKKGNACLYTIYGLLLLGLILCVTVHFAAGMLVIMPVILVFLRYNEKYASICGTMKHAPQERINKMLSGNWDTTPSYPHSGVYCGDYAFFCEKENLLVSLEDMAWVYMTETKTKAMGFFTLYVLWSVNFCYRSGGQASCVFDENELSDLLNKKIIPLNPNLMIGYTEENKKAYAEMVGKN